MDYFYKNIYPIIVKGIKEFFEALGILITIAEIFERLETLLKIDICVNKFLFSILLPVITIFIIIKNLPKKEFPYYIKNRDINIKLVIGDVLEQDATIVIPTNTTFDTRMDNEFISEKSIQGQFQKKYFYNKLNTLDRMIEAELENIPENEILKDRINTKNKKYEIGTTVELNISNKRFYLLADSNINKHGQTISPSLENVTDALSRFWQYIGERGHVESIAIPIIGTGRMGIINSREEVIRKILFSFIASNTCKKIATELKLCIRKEDVKKYNMNLFEIRDYIEYLCKYQYEHNDMKEGIAIK